MNVVLAAGGGNRHGRVGRSTAKCVDAVGIRPKDRGIAVLANFPAPFQRVGSVQISEILL